MSPYPLEGRGAILQPSQGKRPLQWMWMWQLWAPALSFRPSVGQSWQPLSGNPASVSPRYTYLYDQCTLTGLWLSVPHAICDTLTAVECTLSYQDSNDIMMLTCVSASGPSLLLHSYQPAEALS